MKIAAHVAFLSDIREQEKFVGRQIRRIWAKRHYSDIFILQIINCFPCCVGTGIVVMKNDAVIFVAIPDFVDEFWQTNFYIPFSINSFFILKEWLRFVL